MTSSGVEESSSGVLSSRTVHQPHNPFWTEQTTIVDKDGDKDKDKDQNTNTSVIEETNESSASNYEEANFLQQEDEFKLDIGPSLIIMILQNVLLQISFFSIVSSSSAYAEYLGGTATFSGLVIGIPTAISGLTLIPLMKYDKGLYKMPLHITCASMVIGSMLYGLAYKAKFLYLILLGRMIQGSGMIGFLYTKRYCTDSRVVGIRRRTTLAGWLVLGQGIGMSAGPFFGGLLYKLGFNNSIFNGYTGPGWVMAGVWLAFWAASTVLFKDIQPNDQSHSSSSIQMSVLPPPSTARPSFFQLSKRQWGVMATMCWFAMTCFFILGAWESNIPVFASSSSSISGVKFTSLFSEIHIHNKAFPRAAYPLGPFSWSPFASGNFIALGGITIFPFLFLNLLLARRIQDRHILALGSGLGLAGLLTTLALLRAQPVSGVLSYGAFFACWFLVALGFNLASTCTLSLLSKQLPSSWNKQTSLAIQYSNFTGRVTGAVWGGSGVKVGMLNYVGLEIAIIGVGAVMFLTLWRELKAKTG